MNPDRYAQGTRSGSGHRGTVKGIGILFAAAVLVATGCMASQPPNPNPSSQPIGDAALCFPEFAELARQYPADWEERVHPSIRPIIGLQRSIGQHALVVGFADEEPSPTYPNPNPVVSVAYWDGTDLFSLGVPRTYNGKPVVIMDRKEPPKALPGDGAVGIQTAPTAVAGCPGPQ